MSVLPRVLLLTTFAFAACGGGASGGLGPSPSGTPPSDASTGQVVMVTRASDRQTVTAHVGDLIQIALGEQFAWQLEPPDGIVLDRQTPQTYMLVRGTQAIWVARSPGTSTITASGTLVCPSGQACAQLMAFFSCSVDVLP